MGDGNIDLTLARAMAPFRKPLTVNIRTFFQTANPEFLDETWLMPRVIQPVYLMGRRFTGPTQTPDEIVDANGRLKVTFGTLGSGVPTTAWNPGNAGIGDVNVVSSGATAGNATATAQASVSPATAQIWEILSILLTAKCDATVASRVMQLQITTGLPAAALMAVATNDFFLTGPTLTQSQEGRVFVPGSPGQIQLNDNGTITQSNTNPTPLLVADTVTVSDLLASGVAGDNHVAAFVARRVA